MNAGDQIHKAQYHSVMETNKVVVLKHIARQHKIILCHAALGGVNQQRPAIVGPPMARLKRLETVGDETRVRLMQ